MSRKLIGMLSLVLLAGALSGASYAGTVPTQVTFGPSPLNSVTFSHIGAGTSVTFSGVAGVAEVGVLPFGTFSISDGTIAFAGLDPSTPGYYLLAPNAEVFTATIGSSTLVGNLSLTDVSASWAPQFLGTLHITSTTGIFPGLLYNLGETVDTDFSVYLGRTSVRSEEHTSELQSLRH